MGEIIRPDFSRRKKEEPEQDDEGATIKITNLPTKVPPEGIDAAKTAFSVADGDEQGTFLPEYLELTLSGKVQKLLNLTASPSALLKAREIVRNYTTEELLGWMKNSTEDDWQKRAGFFQAIWAELKRRMKI